MIKEQKISIIVCYKYWHRILLFIELHLKIIIVRTLKFNKAKFGKKKIENSRLGKFFKI